MTGSTPIVGGFGERTFVADGRTIRVEPKPVKKADGRTNISLGFPFATLSEGVGDDVPADLAEYLSCPKRASAPELYEALALALEYWAHRQQRYKNRHPAWVQAARAAMAKARGAAQ